MSQLGTTKIISKCVLGLILGFLSNVYADLPDPKVHTEGQHCTDCHTLKLLNDPLDASTFLQKVIDWPGTRKLERPSLDPELAKIGICGQAGYSATCFIAEDPCVVITAVHVTNPPEKAFTEFKPHGHSSEGDITYSQEWNKLYQISLKKTQDIRELIAKAPNETLRRGREEALKKYMDANILTASFARNADGSINTKDRFETDAILYANPICDLVAYRVKPRQEVDGQGKPTGKFVCPGDLYGKLKLLDTETLTKVEKPSQSASLPSELKSAAFIGFPDFGSSKTEKYNDLRGSTLDYPMVGNAPPSVVRSSNVLEDDRYSHFKAPACSVAEFSTDTLPGMSSSPYLIGKKGQGDRAVAGVVVGPVGGVERNYSYIISPVVRERILEAIRSDSQLANRKPPEEKQKVVNKGPKPNET